MNVKIGQCEVSLSFPFFAAVAAALVLDRTGYIGLGLFAALLHESGHLLAMALVHSLPQKIRFSAFRIDIVDQNRTRQSYQKDILILLGGPLMNFAAALGLLPFANGEHPFLLYLLCANLILGVFNLLPIEALDGGQLLVALLLPKIGPQKCAVLINVLSVAVIVPLGVLGFLVLLQSKYNFSLLFLSCYLMALMVLRRTHTV